MTQIFAALIAVAGTVLVAVVGFVTTLKVARSTIQAGHEDTGKTLKEQHTRTLNERFSTAADKLGSHESAAVRLAGVHAMASLADDWLENRQTCVDVLCAYLRMPYGADTREEGSPESRLAVQGEREVRHTVIRVITAHLRDGAAKSWQGLNFDFTGVVFDGGDFSGARFSGGEVRFVGADFAGGTVNFAGAKFSGATAIFGGARFSCGTVNFAGSEFSGGTVNFRFAKVSGGTVNFAGARFTGSDVTFARAEFSGGMVNFAGTWFIGGRVNFGGEYADAALGSGGDEAASLQVDVGTIYFSNATFSGDCTVDFRYVSNWSQPPIWECYDAPIPGVLWPDQAGQPVPRYVDQGGQASAGGQPDSRRHNE